MSFTKRRKTQGENMTYEELEKLTLKELKQLQNNIAYWISIKNQDADSQYAELLYHYLTDHLSRITRKDYPPYFVYISKNKATRNTEQRLKVVSGDLREYLTSICKGVEQDKTTVTKFLKLFSDLMISNIDENLELPLNLGTVLSMADDFPSILDRAFPGYIESGLIKMII